MKQDGIIVKAAGEHNLKDIDVFIPRDKITVITGLSGSGKSSLAFDTIYAEGQRRYVESLSSYARQFLQQLKKPKIESISGLSPSIAIEQKTISANPRSTVGTMTEVYDYLRLLYAKVGIPSCPTHNIPVSSWSPQQIVDDIMSQKKGTKFYLLAPVVRGKKGEFSKEVQKWIKAGFTKAKIDGEWTELASVKRLKKTMVHDIDILVDRLVVEDKFLARLKESVNQAISLADGRVSLEFLNGEIKGYSIHNACPKCGYNFPDLEPRLFSFNNARGACQTCDGFGYLIDVYEVEDEDETFEEPSTCPDCKGLRLRPESLNIFFQDKNIGELSLLSVEELKEFFDNITLKSNKLFIAEKITDQIKQRLSYLLRVGCDYLSLSRPTRTLSGGEAQRVRLASQVGSSLIGVLYVLDEPSIGLHPRDHHRLLEIIEEIKDRGNTILMVEHDEDTILAADHVIDLGPGAGKQGGHLLAKGTPDEIKKNKNSVTGLYLSGKNKIPLPEKRRPASGLFVKINKAQGNNLKNIDVKIPLGCFVCVTGVSGSGKSTLIRETLYKHIAHTMHGAHAEPAEFESIEGLENLDKVIEINQKPIGRTPRSIPATYVGLFPLIRSLFANLPEAQIRGFTPGHFSFNVKGGRCENCQGAGKVKLEMHFLSNVFVTCEQCQGMRYNHELLSIKYKDKNMNDILNMTVSEALEFFQHHKHIARKLKTLEQVGLDYMTLGQSSTTLSGGEAQRVKLSKELSKRSTGKTFYILDEPTTGLHFEDIKKLTELLQELVEQGNTVLVIEHNMEVVKCSDHIIDIGPEGGRHGGNLVASGTPEEVVKVKESYTGQFLKKYLQ